MPKTPNGIGKVYALICLSDLKGKKVKGEG